MAPSVDPSTRYGDSVLNVLMTATSYPAGDADWRGRFIYDMAESLASSGQVGLRLWAPPGRLPAGVGSALIEDDASRGWRRFLNQGGIAHLLRRHPSKGGLSVPSACCGACAGCIGILPILTRRPQ